MGSSAFTSTSGIEYSDHITKTSAKVMVNGDVIFTVVGDVQILSLISECITANNATASTLQYSVTTALAQTQTITGVSGVLTNAIAGTTIVTPGAALTDIPIISASGVTLNTTARGIRIPPGSITTVIGVGSTTGTWQHYVRWEPLEDGAYIIAAF